MTTTLPTSAARVLMVFAVVAVAAHLCLAAPLRGMPGGGSARVSRVEKVESSIRNTLELVFGEANATASRHVSSIEASLWRTFQALPKNSLGRLAPRAVRHIVHNYFSKEHGWLIKGLEPHGMVANVTELQEAMVLQDKAPALVEALLEAQMANRGLSLSDVVAMVAALERLIFDESIQLLKESYMLNDQSTSSQLDERALDEVLTSYLMLFGYGSYGRDLDIQQHKKIKAVAPLKLSSWPDLVAFERDAVMNYAFAQRSRISPFTAPRYTFEAAAQCVEDMMRGYGRWQDSECRHMKGALMEMDPEGSGRVPVGRFYSQKTGSYQFAESIEYLRSIGALDEPARGGPWVRIPNYLLSPSNCIASSSYYSVCCLNECDGLMTELEGQVQAPLVPVERLLKIVANISSSSVDAPRRLPSPLISKLHGIAGHHGGDVPLHGRLFAQWLHFAFPNECPYPQVLDDATTLTVGKWKKGNSSVSPDDRQRHVEGIDSEEPRGGDEEALWQWNDREVLPLRELDRPLRQDSLLGAVPRGVLRVAALAAALLVGLRTVWLTGWGGATTATATAACARGYGGAAGKPKAYELPMYY